MLTLKWIAGGICCCLFGAGCTPIAKMIVGVKRPSEPGIQTLHKWVSRSHIGEYPVYTLDTTYAALIQDKAADQLSLKAYSQPILILSFVEGKVVSLNNNCSFPGLPRIHWNIFGTFNQFPPSSFFQDSTIQILQFSELAKTLVPLNEKAINQPNFKDTLMVVMVSKTYGRQSNGLIQTIRTQYPNQTDKILFVNNDFYIYHKLNTGFN
jgi:hypothetical protein